MKIGLALSGGGIKGLIHVGFIKALQENNIDCSVIAGTSAGALVGALYAKGYKPEKMVEFFKTAPLFKYSYYSLKKPGIFDSVRYQSFLRKYFDDNFSQFEKELYIITTNLEKGEWQAHNQGELFRKLIASAALPPVFTPIKIDWSLHSDGGIMNNFPIEPLVGQCDKIIGSHVSYAGPTVQSNINSSIKLIVRSSQLMLQAQANAKMVLSDYTFQPKESMRISSFNVKQIDEAFELGYQEGILQMDTLKKSLDL